MILLGLPTLCGLCHERNLPYSGAFFLFFFFKSEDYKWFSRVCDTSEITCRFLCVSSYILFFLRKEPDAFIKFSKVKINNQEFVSSHKLLNQGRNLWPAVKNSPPD